MFIQENVQDFTFNMPLKPLKTKGRLEKIMRNPVAAAQYAIKVLQKKWPEAEPYILQDGWASCLYARSVIKRRWPEAEQAIMKDGSYTCMSYAIDVLKQRWPEAEPVIKQDDRV